MPKKSRDALRRSDRILVGALVVVLAAVSATVGAATVYHPRADQIRKNGAPIATVAQAAAPVQPILPASMEELATSSAFELEMKKKLLKEHNCLSEALYYEARGEGEKGQTAIAEVIFTRIRTGRYGQSICAVVYEGAGQPNCQFSFACNGAMRAPKNPVAWMKAQRLAVRILTGEEPLKNATGGAVNFHATSVEPVWAGELARTAQIGNHIFYKNGVRARDM